MSGGYKWTLVLVLIVTLASVAHAEMGSVPTDEVSDTINDFRDFSYREISPGARWSGQILGALDAKTPAPWWNNTWHSRSPIEITAFENVSTLSVYELTLNTHELVARGLIMPNCIDLRVVWYNRDLEENVDLDYDMWDCDNESTLIFFRNQKPESIGDVNDYYLYYQGEDMTLKPINKSNIYFYYEEHFDNVTWFYHYYDPTHPNDPFLHNIGPQLRLSEPAPTFFHTGDYAAQGRIVNVPYDMNLILQFRERDNIGYCEGGSDLNRKRFYFNGVRKLDQSWCQQMDDTNWHLRQYFIPVLAGPAYIEQNLYTNDDLTHCKGEVGEHCDYDVDEVSMRDYSLHSASIGSEESIGCSYDLEPVKIEFDDIIGVFVYAYIKNNGLCGVADAEVEFLDTYNGELINTESVTIGPISPGSTEFTSVYFPIERNHDVYVLVDPDNKIKESNKDNNAIHKEFVGSTKYYVEADVPPFVASIEIENFVKENLHGIVTPFREDADVTILIARHNPLIVWHFETLEQKGWGFYGGTIQYQDKNCFEPYCGIVGSFEKDGKDEVYIEANDVDGFVAAARAFVDNQDSITAGKTIFLGEDDVDAIGVYDYLHNPDNVFYYKQNNEEFEEIVGKALKRERYNIIDSEVLVNDTRLRLRNLQPKNTELFQEFVDSDNLPVVMAGGLWSDITAWDELGKELADSGYDVFLLELTGGPGMECNNCTDYTYEFLTDDVYPAYIDEVKNLSGQSRIKYVGHSNGARVALDSLTSGQVNPDDVETLVLVGVPGNFSELTKFTQVINQSGDVAIHRMREKNLEHVTNSRIAHELDNIWGEIGSAYLFVYGSNKISLTLFERYYEWINGKFDAQPGSTLNVDNFALIYSTEGTWDKGLNDDLVPVSDEIAIFSNVHSAHKDLINVTTGHAGMCTNDQIEGYIKEEIKKRGEQ
jgi:pimeloyl-ACP methyl ester carboxylesterase